LLFWSTCSGDAPPRINAGDQERLDDLLRILNRRTAENIAAQDFYATWNGRIINPVKAPQGGGRPADRVPVTRKVAGQALVEVGATSVVLSAMTSSAWTTTA
jgi:hypothetical protein